MQTSSKNSLYFDSSILLKLENKKLQRNYTLDMFYT